MWGGLIGLLPHVLHHVGPLAGAAILAGAGGTLLFAAIGFVAAIPFLRATAPALRDVARTGDRPGDLRGDVLALELRDRAGHLRERRAEPPGDLEQSGHEQHH